MKMSLWPGRLLPEFLGNRRRIIAPARRESQRSAASPAQANAGKIPPPSEEVAMSILSLRSFRARLGAWLVVLAVLTGAAVWYVSYRGGWQSVVKIQPTLDPSSPRSQNGYTVASVAAINDPTDTGAVSVLIVPPSFPSCSPGYRSPDGVVAYDMTNGQKPSIVQASAHLSSGDTTSVKWDFVGDGSPAPRYLRLTLPGGYSNDARFADITLVPASGPFPRWRIARLPYMHQNLPDHPAIVDHITKSGIASEAHAYRVRDQIYFRVLPTLPANSHQWELTGNSPTMQFEKQDRPHQGTPYTRFPIEGRGANFTPKDLSNIGALIYSTSTNYRSASRYARLECTLHQFETIDERVTFPSVAVVKDLESSGHRQGYGDMNTYCISVAKPITLLTPSGLVVTLPAQSKNNRYEAGKINFSLTVKPIISPLELPASLLIKQFGKSISISVKMASPDELSGWSIDPGETQHYVLWPPQNPRWSGKMSIKEMRETPLFLAPPPRRDFTIIIHERVELQTIPMTFTVPVSDTLPPAFH